MIDASCNLWETKCGIIGSCWIYNNYEMSKRLFILVVILKCLSITFNVLAFVLYKPPPTKEDAVVYTKKNNTENEDHEQSNSLNQVHPEVS